MSPTLPQSSQSHVPVGLISKSHELIQDLERQILHENDPIFVEKFTQLIIIVQSKLAAIEEEIQEIKEHVR